MYICKYSYFPGSDYFFYSCSTFSESSMHTKIHFFNIFIASKFE